MMFFTNSGTIETIQNLCDSIPSGIQAVLLANYGRTPYFNKKSVSSTNVPIILSNSCIFLECWKKYQLHKEEPELRNNLNPFVQRKLWIFLLRLTCPYMGIFSLLNYSARFLKSCTRQIPRSLPLRVSYDALKLAFIYVTKPFIPYRVITRTNKMWQVAPVIPEIST
jgi:hypothetical protein